MYQSISFYIGTDTLVLNDHTFRLGDITTEVLNITPEEYERMKQLLDEAEEKIHLYRHTRKLDDWRDANKLYIQLDDMLCSRQVFRLLKLEPCILQDAEMMFAELDQTKLEGFDYPPRYDLIFPGSLNDKWIAYEHHCKVYGDILDDIFSFNYTIQRFLYYYLSRLKKLDPENYAAALYSFLYEGPTEKLVANPFGGSGLYSNADPVTMRFVPRLIDPDGEEYQIYEYYEVQKLQTLLKMDFYRGLKVGHVIRRCEFCKRYFLMTKGYHTKYCDQPNPIDPKHTCAQLGYRQTCMKEAAKDDPMKQSLFRCYQRLTKDVSRGNLTSEQREKLYETAVNLQFDARRNPEVSFEEFDTMLSTANLCALCCIERKAGKVGRPKRGEAKP